MLTARSRLGGICLTSPALAETLAAMDAAEAARPCALPPGITLSAEQLKKVRRIGIPLLVRLAYTALPPNARREVEAVKAAIWITDDFLDGDAPLATRRDVVEDIVSGTSRTQFGGMWRTLVDDYKRQGRFTTLFHERVKQYVRGVLCMEELAAATGGGGGGKMSRAEYLRVRIDEDECAVKLSLSIPSLYMPRRAAEVLYTRSDVRALMRDVGEHVAVMNDLFSFELDRGSGRCNALSFEIAASGDPPEAAAERITARCNALAETIMATWARMPRGSVYDAMALEAFLNWPTANCVWSLACGRYKGRDHALAIMRAAAGGARNDYASLWRGEAAAAPRRRRAVEPPAGGGPAAATTKRARRSSPSP